jgi:DNA polymerase I-like protein with 3'-5' exonuclease and polymerase domains
LRSLIQPDAGRAVVYVDYEQQEFGIAAALSGDPAMAEAYRTGDPYLAFGKQAGVIPPDGTKTTHAAQRSLFKSCVLATQYGMGEAGLAAKIGKPTAVARELLALHRRTYPRFWAWSQAAVDRAVLTGKLETVFGWPIRVGASADQRRPGVNPRRLQNFPCQGNGAEMLRLACCLLVERGICVTAPIHDAVLIEGPADRIEEVVAETQAAMAEASRAVLAGFEISTDAKIVVAPDRYVDEAGFEFWETVMRLAGPRENFGAGAEEVPQDCGTTSTIPPNRAGLLEESHRGSDFYIGEEAGDDTP